MPRRSAKATPSQVAAAIRKTEKAGFGGILAKQLERDITRAIARSLQEFAVKASNDLVKEGPLWSGEFAASWDFVVSGEAGQTSRKATENGYTYTRRNFNLGKIERAIENGSTRFELVNTSSHAAIAIDQEQGYFKRVGNPLDPSRLEFGIGRPQPSLRYDIGGETSARTLKEASASRTAPPDWFYTYLQGGGLQRSLNAGFDVGFKERY